MERYVIPNLRNACRVLKLLANTDRPFSTKEVANALDLPRTSAMRILSTLTLEGFARKEDERFSLGSALISIGSAARSKLNLGDLAKPLLARVTQKTGETCHLAVPSERRSLILAVNFGPHPLSSSRGPGSLVELHCSAAGKCLLAHAYDSPVEKLLKPSELHPHTAKTIVSLTALREEIERVRETGFAVDEQEFFEGVRCIAAPVFDSDQRCVAAIGITASTTRFATDRIDSFARTLIEEADELSRLLGRPSPTGLKASSRTRN